MRQLITSQHRKTWENPKSSKWARIWSLGGKLLTNAKRSEMQNSQILDIREVRNKKEDKEKAT